MSSPSTVTVLNLMSISFRVDTGPGGRSEQLTRSEYTIPRTGINGPDRGVARVRGGGRPAELRRGGARAPALASGGHARRGRARAAAGRAAPQPHDPLGVRDRRGRALPRARAA